MRRTVVLALLASLGATGCKPVKRLLRGKYVTSKITATPSLTKKSGRTYAVKLAVKTDPEADVAAFVSGELGGRKTTKASKSGEAELEFEWNAAAKPSALVSVSSNKRDPNRLLFLEGDEHHGDTTVTLEEPWGFDAGNCFGKGPSCAISSSGVELSVVAPVDTKVTFHGQHVVKGAVARFPLPAAELERLAAHAFDAKPFHVDVPVSLAFPDGKTAKGSVAFHAASAKSEFLSKLSGAAKGPVAMPGDDPAPPKARAMWLSSGCSRFVSPGKAAKLADYDLVAFCESKTRARVCGPYHSASGKTASYELHFYDELVKIHDRRTGAVKAQRTFVAPSVGCPSSFMGKGSSSEGSWPDDKAVSAWLKSFVAAP